MGRLLMAFWQQPDGILATAARLGATAVGDKAEQNFYKTLKFLAANQVSAAIQAQAAANQVQAANQVSPGAPKLGSWLIAGP